MQTHVVVNHPVRRSEDAIGKQESPILSASVQTQKAILLLKETIKALQDRLEPVLGPETPTTQDNAEKECSSESKLESIFSDMTSHLYGLNETVKNLISRVRL